MKNIETIKFIGQNKTAGNSTYPKVAVQSLNQALCFYQSLCLVDSEVLRNRHLRVAATVVCNLLPMNDKIIKINRMKKIIVSLITFLLISCGSEQYKYHDSIIIKTTKDSQSSDLKKISVLIQNISKEGLRDQLLIRFPDALTDYTDKIHLQVKSVKKTFGINWLFKKTIMSKFSVIVMVQMNYDNLKENQANQIVNYYKELVIAELNKNGIIINN